MFNILDVLASSKNVKVVVERARYDSCNPLPRFWTILAIGCLHLMVLWIARTIEQVPSVQERAR
jgi:hypothetical protein